MKQTSRGRADRDASIHGWSGMARGDVTERRSREVPEPGRKPVCWAAAKIRKDVDIWIQENFLPKGT